MPFWADLYTTNPSYFPLVGVTLSFVAGGGSGAIVYAVVTAGVITSYTIISGGTGYANGPFAVSVTGGGGSGASITATASGGVIGALSIGSGGTGYQGTAPAWKLNISNNAWDTLVQSIGNWRDNVNGNQKNLTNLGSLALAPLSLPGSPVAGELAVDGGNNLNYYTGTAWKNISNYAPPKSQAHNTAAQSIPNATFTSLSFDTNDYDVGPMHSTSVNPTRFTVPANGGGYYLIIGRVTFGSSLAITGRLFVNGGAASMGGQVSSSVMLTVPAVMILNAGDYVEWQVFQSSGGAQNTVAGADQSSVQIIRLDA